MHKITQYILQRDRNHMLCPHIHPVVFHRTLIIMVVIERDSGLRSHSVSIHPFEQNLNAECTVGTVLSNWACFAWNVVAWEQWESHDLKC